MKKLKELYFLSRDFMEETALPFSEGEQGEGDV